MTLEITSTMDFLSGILCFMPGAPSQTVNVTVSLTTSLRVLLIEDLVCYPTRSVRLW